MTRTNPSRPSFLLASLLVLSTLAAVHALPSSSPSSLSSPFRQRRADPVLEPCGFDGDDNTYGLGIRLGLYFQWLSTMLSNFIGIVKPEEAKSMKGVNLCFQASVFGGLLYVTITRGTTQNAGQLYAAEIWVILCLCLGGVLTISPEPKDRAYVIHDVCQQALNVAMASYTLWFIFTGMDQMAHPPCSRYSFFYTKVDMYHWFRLFWKITMIPATCTVVFSLGWSLLRLRVPGMRRLFDDAEHAWGRSQPIFWVLSPSFALGSTIASTELIIRWNHIQNVNSVGGTGQLIPLIVSCLSFIRLAYKLFTQARPEKTNPPTNSPSFVTNASLHLTV